MKPASYPRAFLLATACSFLLAACGQRGPLYLPAKPVPLSTAPLSAPPQPAAPAGASSNTGNPAIPSAAPNSSK